MSPMHLIYVMFTSPNCSIMTIIESNVKCENVKKCEKR